MCGLFLKEIWIEKSPQRAELELAPVSLDMTLSTATDVGCRNGYSPRLRGSGGLLPEVWIPTKLYPIRSTSFSIVSSPIRFIATDSSSLRGSPSRSRNDPSIPDSARSRQPSSR
jgi:hypothetical protein